MFPFAQDACRCTLQRCLKERPRKLNNQTAQSLSRDVALLPASIVKCKANPQSTIHSLSGSDRRSEDTEGQCLATAFMSMVLVVGRNTYRRFEAAGRLHLQGMLGDRPSSSRFSVSSNTRRHACVCHHTHTHTHTHIATHCSKLHTS